jgi:hypothetical protein
MRYHVLVLVLGAALSLSLRGADGSRVTQATDAMIDAVVTRVSPGEDVPPRPPISGRVKAGVAAELWNHPTLQASYQKLAAGGSEHDWTRAIEELEEGRAAWCLASALCHPSDDVQIRCAKALGRIGDPAPTRWVLVVADAYAVPESGGENAALHGEFQHALANTLNILTNARIKLKDGQDPQGLRAAIAKWKRALRERSGPMVRSQAAQRRIDSLLQTVSTFTLTVALWPEPEGQWNPKYELQSITLGVGEAKAAQPRLNPAGRPSELFATLTPDQAGILIDALADAGYFDHATSDAATRTDRHCMVEIAHGPADQRETMCLCYDWKPPLAPVLDTIRDALDGEPYRVFNQLVGPMTPQREAWERQAMAAGNPVH